jgi:hypothetical protein
MEALGNGGGLGVVPTAATRWRRADEMPRGEGQHTFASPLLDANLAIHSSLAGKRHFCFCLVLFLYDFI